MPQVVVRQSLFRTAQQQQFVNRKLREYQLIKTQYACQVDEKEHVRETKTYTLNVRLKFYHQISRCIKNYIIQLLSSTLRASFFSTDWQYDFPLLSLQFP